VVTHGAAADKHNRSAALLPRSFPLHYDLTSQYGCACKMLHLLSAGVQLAPATIHLFSVLLQRQSSHMLRQRQQQGQRKGTAAVAFAFT
jgi:hypothetical protein